MLEKQAFLFRHDVHSDHVQFHDDGVATRRLAQYIVGDMDMGEFICNDDLFVGSALVYISA